MLQGNDTLNDELSSIQDWELVAQVCQAYRNLSDAFIDRIGMYRAQAAVLCRLYAQDGMTQTEIGDQLSVQGATVTNMLQRMEEPVWFLAVATRRITAWCVSISPHQGRKRSERLQDNSWILREPSLRVSLRKIERNSAASCGNYCITWARAGKLKNFTHLIS